MKNSELRKILKSDRVDIPEQAKKRTAELALREAGRMKASVSEHEAEAGKFAAVKASKPGARLIKPVLKLSLAALITALALAHILSIGKSRSLPETHGAQTAEKITAEPTAAADDTSKHTAPAENNADPTPAGRNTGILTRCATNENLLPSVWSECFDNGNLVFLTYSEVSPDEYAKELELSLIPQEAELLGMRYARLKGLMQLVFIDAESLEQSACVRIPGSAELACRNLKIYGDTLYYLERSEEDACTRVSSYSSRGEFLGAIECEEDGGETERYNGVCAAVFDAESPRAIVGEMVEKNGEMYVKRSMLDLNTGKKTVISNVAESAYLPIRQPLAFYGENRLEILGTSTVYNLIGRGSDVSNDFSWHLMDGKSGQSTKQVREYDPSKHYDFLCIRSGSHAMLAECDISVTKTDTSMIVERSNERALLIDLADCTVGELKFETSDEYACAVVSSDGSVVVTYDAARDETGRTPRVIRIYDAETGALINSFELSEEYDIPFLYPQSNFVIDPVNGRLYISVLVAEDGTAAHTGVLSYDF